MTSAGGAQSPKFLSINCFPPPSALKNSIPRSNNTTPPQYRGQKSFICSIKITHHPKLKCIRIYPGRRMQRRTAGLFRHSSEAFIGGVLVFTKCSIPILYSGVSF